MWGVIFGGSFNPLHEGHEGLVAACAEFLGPCVTHLMPLAESRLSSPAVPGRHGLLQSLLARNETLRLVPECEGGDDRARFRRLAAGIRAEGLRCAALIGADVLTRGEFSCGLLRDVLAETHLVVGQRQGYDPPAELLCELWRLGARHGHAVIILPKVSSLSSTDLRAGDSVGGRP